MEAIQAEILGPSRKEPMKKNAKVTIRRS